MMTDKLADVFCTVLRLQPEDLKANPRLGGVERWDSLQHMNLIAAIEQAYGIELTFEEIVEMKSWEEAQAVLEKKLSRAA